MVLLSGIWQSKPESCDQAVDVVDFVDKVDFSLRRPSRNVSIKGIISLFVTSARRAQKWRTKKPTWALPTTQSLFVLVFVIVIVIEARTPRYSHSTNHGTSIGCVSCRKTSCCCW